MKGEGGNAIIMNVLMYVCVSQGEPDALRGQKLGYTALVLGLFENTMPLV